MDQMIEFAQQVGAKVEQMYGLEDGSSLCYNLLEAGVVTISQGVMSAATVVAMYIEQM